MREAFVLAAEIAGGGGPDGLVKYLARQADEHPVAFINAMSKCIPLQVEGKGGNVTIQIVKRFDAVVEVTEEREPLTIEHQTNGHGNGRTGPASE